ncbi:Pleckstrin y domain-containing F member 2, partial [Blyttiomyces sp. JEL0837]
DMVLGQELETEPQQSPGGKDQALKPRMVIVFSDMLIYGTTRNFSNGGEENMVVFNFDQTDVVASLDSEDAVIVTTTQDQQQKSCTFSFHTPMARDEWIQSVRSVIEAHHTRRLNEMRRRRKRQSSASSTHSEWSLFRSVGNSVGAGGGGGGGGSGAVGGGRDGGDSASEVSVSSSVGGDGNGGNGGRSGSAAGSYHTWGVSSFGSDRSHMNAQWIPDAEATVCMICQTTKFTLITRKHHCRQCGRVICYKCSRFQEFSSLTLSYKASHSTAPDKMVRVCTDCYLDGSGTLSSASQSNEFESETVSSVAGV